MSLQGGMLLLLEDADQCNTRLFAVQTGEAPRRAGPPVYFEGQISLQAAPAIMEVRVSSVNIRL